jgi:hypothetical protein
MPILSVPPLIVLLPILLCGAWLGLRRGWKDEAWTAGALLVTLFVVARPETVLLPTLERLIGAFQRAGQALLGQDTGGDPFHFEGASRPLAQLLAFLLFVALAYALGQLLGKGEQGGGLWKILAILLGGFNLAVVVSWLASNFLAARNEDGSVRLVIPSFTGAEVVFGTPTTNNILASWPGLIGLLVVVIALVFILTRARVWR